MPDLDALIQRLRAHGMKPSPPRASERGRMIAFEDSEGNALHASEFDPRWVKEAKYPLPAFAKRRAKRA